MLPVTTRPPRRPGGFGSPFSRPREIDLDRHHHHHRPRLVDDRKRDHRHDHGHDHDHDRRRGLFVLDKGCWIVKCGPGNSCLMTYQLLDEDEECDRDHDRDRDRDEDHELNPWNRRDIAGYPPPDWSRPPRPPRPSNVVRQEELIRSNTTGVAFADGQNVTIEGCGTAVIIQVFSV